MTRWFPAVVSLIVLMSVPLPALADFDTGLTAYQARDFATALREWKALAEEGHALAQFRLAIMYSRGEGIRINQAEALRWYLLAAEQGLPQAENNIAYMYRSGQGVPKDDEQAFFWYTRAAGRGDGRGQFNLGAMYAMGKGTQKNNVQAFVWFALAAARGLPDARNGLAAIVFDMTAEEIDQAQKQLADSVKQ